MRQAGAVLRLVVPEGQDPAGNPRSIADTGDQLQPQAERPNREVARGARHDLLTEWMGTHTQVLGLWLDRLLEDGDDGELVSMIHRQHAWLAMMQTRLERG